MSRAIESANGRIMDQLTEIAHLREQRSELAEALQACLHTLEGFYEDAQNDAFVHKQVALPWPEIKNGYAALKKAGF